MGTIRRRLVRLGLAGVLCGAGLVTYQAVTQVASAAAPPVINTDFAAYPPANAVPANCTGGVGGTGVLVGYRAFIDPTGVAPARVAANPTAFADPGPGGDFATLRSLRRFQALITPNDRVVVRWTDWAANCNGLTISFPLKATNQAFFDLSDDQALVREPNGPYNFPFCNAGTDPCPGPAGVGGFELSTVVPQLNVVCGYQLDVIIGGPLETVGPHGSYYQTANRQQANAAGLGTFNPNNPSMLIDAANGAMPCTPNQRITIDKEWIATGGITPPANVPPGFQLTVTSSVSQTDPTVISTATCTVANGAFGCTYADAANPTQPQGGLRVNPDSLLTVSETGFPESTPDITFPVGLSSRFVTCQNISGPCLLTVTNASPPPPTPPTTPPTAAPTTVPASSTPTTPTTAPTTSPISLTLPPTGSSGSTPMTLLGLALIPLGGLLILLTRRRADQI